MAWPGMAWPGWPGQPARGDGGKRGGGAAGRAVGAGWGGDEVAWRLAGLPWLSAAAF